MEEEIPIDDPIDEVSQTAKATDKKTPVYYEESDVYGVFESPFIASVSEETQS